MEFRPGKIIKSSNPKRTFVSEDVKHILDGIDSILHIYNSIIDSMFSLNTINKLKPTFTDFENIIKRTENE